MGIKIFKITLLGDGAVGKTSLKRNYMGEDFINGYKMTIGADFAVKKLKLDGNDITLQIWDLAGQPRFDAVREAYYGGTKGALLVFDITRPDTYEILPKWLTELVKNNNNKKVPLILIGNKKDLRDEAIKTVPEEYAVDYAEKLSAWSGFDVTYVETSAKTGENVEQAFYDLAIQIIQHADKLKVEMELV
ncbi:MAG: GTP-binding protein [Candidatus Heimdallarchaeaceae archaeon]